MNTIATEGKKGWWQDLFSSRKPQSWLVAAVLVSAGGLLLMSLGGIDSSGQKRLGQPETIIPEAVSQQPQGNGMERDESFLEAKLERILGEIEGVGSVSATVTLAAGPQYDYAVNVTTSQRSVNENDQSGGTRSTTEQNRDGQLVLLKTAQSGVEQPVVVRETSPEVRGVLVVAAGARDIRVKAKIVQAVQTIFDIPVHKVNVFDKGR